MTRRPTTPKSACDAIVRCDGLYYDEGYIEEEIGDVDSKYPYISVRYRNFWRFFQDGTLLSTFTADAVDHVKTWLTEEYKNRPWRTSGKYKVVNGMISGQYWAHSDNKPETCFTFEGQLEDGILVLREHSSYNNTTSSYKCSFSSD